MIEKPPDLERPLTIILAEDNPDHAELALLALEDLPWLCSIHVATTGEQVLDCLEVLNPLPDAILLDIKMPRMNGIEVMREMKKNEAWSDIPVIVMSTSTNPDEVGACKSLGALAYITKPICNEELLQVLKTAKESNKQRGQI